MPAIRLALGATVAVAALAAAGCGGGGGEAGGTTETTTTETTATETSAGTAGGTLIGTIGSPGSPDDFVISLTTEDGTPVTTLAPGEYTLEVDDPSTIHNFRLTGPGGVDVASDVGGTGTESFTVTLEAGTYRFQCDPHASTMSGDFEVSG